jgi:predicted ATPase
MKEGSTMLTSMSLTNFKSWPKVDVLLGRISVFFGANSSGKTSLLQALLALKQTAASFDRRRAFDFGEEGKEQDLVVLGAFRDVVHQHEITRPVSIRLDWRPAAPALLGSNMTADAITYEVEWSALQDDVNVNRIQYQTAEVQFDLKRQHAKFPPYQWSLSRPDHDRLDLNYTISPPDSCYGIPRELARTAVDIDLLEFNHQFELLMERITYLGPLREYPHRRYTWTGAAPQTIDPRGRGTIEALLAAERQSSNGKAHLSTPPIVERVASWLRRFELAEQFQLTPIDREKRIYEARLQTHGADAIITDVGFGVSQVLPIIVLLHFVPEGSIVLLEQPEIHLHPLVQAEMADLFLETAHERNLQLIIESHSEHLLRRLQRRIAEAELPLASPEFIRLYFCELSSQGSTLRQVETDMFGSILNWPDRFFGDEAGDLDAMTQAALRRKKDLMSRG